MLKGRNAGVARILRGTGPDHAGMGIIIGRQHVLTCAHVVNLALGRNIDDATLPHDKAIIHLDLPFLPGVGALRAVRVRWRGVDQPDGDLALLQLKADARSEQGETSPAVGIAVLADVRGVSTTDDVVSVFGYPASHPTGKHVEGFFKAEVAGHRAQIAGRDSEAAFIEGGFSGGGIWDETRDAFVGMVAARERNSDERIAYAVPVSSLKKFAPELEIETRRLFPSFNSTWTVLASVVFALTLLHLLRTQGVEELDGILFWAPHAQLAELWGMHAFMVLGPALFGLLLLHATSFRLHDWWQRVPAFRDRGPAAAARNTSTTAALSLFFFLAWPLYGQGHFIRQFHDHEGVVAIYPGDFGFNVEGLRAKGETCSVESKPVCTHWQAGRYSLVEPIGGSEGGFWNNSYHYGDEHLEKTQTFFPILQPLVIYVMSGIAVLLDGLGVAAIAKPQPSGLKLREERGASISESQQS